MDRAYLRHQLVTLRNRVDEHFEQVQTRRPEAFACAEGCDSCCNRRFSVFAIEAEAIRSALRDLERRDPAKRKRIREQALQVGHCALLVEGRCSVYAARPMICRSHGLAIGISESSEEEEGKNSDPRETSPTSLRVDHCPLNYQDAPPKADEVLVLDAINKPLSVMARLWEQSEQKGTVVSTQAADSERVELALLAQE